MRISNLPGHLRTLRNGHHFVGIARRIGCSQRQARALGKAFQIIRSPREYLLRRRLARKALSGIAVPFSIGDGYVRFSAGDLPFGEDALVVCRTIAEDEKSAYRPEPEGKGFLRSLLSPARLTQYPALLAFATSQEMVAIVTEYLGAVPTLSDLRLWWSVPATDSQPMSSSQKFHQDHEDFRQVKVFLNVHDVTADGGPFTFLPASISEVITSRFPSPFGRFEDADVFAHVEPDDLIVLTGPAGEGSMIDTSNCLHYGSRNDKAERLLLMLHYVGYHSIFEPDSKVITDEIRSEWRAKGSLVGALMRTRPSGL